MRAYPLRNTPSLYFPSEFTLFKKRRSKEVNLTDKFTVAGSFGEIKANWYILQ